MMLTIKFSDVSGTVITSDNLTSGMVGRKAKIEFSEDWDGLRKTIVFQAGACTRDVINPGEVVEIPADVLKNHGNHLFVGAYGVSDDGTVTPTIYAKGPYIMIGANPSGDESTDPTLPVWAQLQREIDNISVEAGALPVLELDHIFDTGADAEFAQLSESDVAKLEALEGAAFMLRAKLGNIHESFCAVPSVISSADGLFFYAATAQVGPISFSVILTNLEGVWIAGILSQEITDGKDGEDGKDGKTAYQYAVDGGYNGSESDFAKKMAAENPTKLSELQNDSEFITAAGAPVQSVNGQTGAVILDADAVGAERSGASAAAVGAHNTNADAHNDIRLLYAALAARMDALANSDDTTLDQMAEVVAYIKANRDLIEQITTGKVSTADIVNNLTTNVANKPLSAAQGVALKGLIDSQNVDLTGYATEQYVKDYAQPKGNYLTEHQDISGKADIDYVDGQIAGVKADAIQQTPLFADSIEECTDTAALYVLPDGYVYAYSKTDKVFTNWLPVSGDGAGGIYNGVGYKENTRWSTSAGATQAQEGVYLSGYIPVQPGAIVRVKNITMNRQAEINQACTIQFFTAIGVHAMQAQHNKWSGDSTTAHAPVWDSAGQLLRFTVPSDGTAYAYIRLQAAYMGADSIVTVDEEITESAGGYAWKNTGHAFIPADYEARIIALEKAVKGDLDVYGIVDKENNVIMSGSLTPGTYTLKYQNADGTTSEIGTFEIS